MSKRFFLYLLFFFFCLSVPVAAFHHHEDGAAHNDCSLCCYAVHHTSSVASEAPHVSLPVVDTFVVLLDHAVNPSGPCQSPYANRAPPA